MPAHALSLAASGGTLYAGGDFALAGGLEAVRIAKWTGTVWEPMGAGVSGENSSVEAIALSTDYVYIGGNFNAAGGAPAYGIAKWKR